MDERTQTKELMRFMLLEPCSSTFPKVEQNAELEYSANGNQMSIRVSPEILALYKTDVFTSVTLTVIIKPDAKWGYLLSLQTVSNSNFECILKLDWLASLLCLERRQSTTNYAWPNYYCLRWRLYCSRQRRQM